MSAHDSVERWLSASYVAEPEPLSPSAARNKESLNKSGAESAVEADVGGGEDRYGKSSMLLLLSWHLARYQMPSLYSACIFAFACRSSYAHEIQSCQDAPISMLMLTCTCRSSNGDEITPGLLAAMRHASQQMASAHTDDSGLSPATAVEEHMNRALTPPPNTPAKQKFDSILGDLSSSGQPADQVAQQSSGSQAPSAAAMSEHEETPAILDKPGADDSITPESTPMHEDARDQSIPRPKEEVQGLTAASIMTPHTKQLAAGYIPRRQQPELSYLDRKVRTLQASVERQSSCKCPVQHCQSWTFSQDEFRHEDVSLPSMLHGNSHESCEPQAQLQMLCTRYAFCIDAKHSIVCPLLIIAGPGQAYCLAISASVMHKPCPACVAWTVFQHLLLMKRQCDHAGG